MRSWFFHPLVFYPLVLVLAALAIGVSLRPQAWPRDPTPVAAQVVEGALVFRGQAFNSPAVDPEQNMTVVRDFWGNALALRIAQRPDQGAPTEAEQGARLLLTAEQAALINDRPVQVEVSYNPVPINAASELAVSLQGGGPAVWAKQESPPQSGTLSFELPAQTAINGIGLRAISASTDQAYGLEITQVRVIPGA